MGESCEELALMNEFAHFVSRARSLDATHAPAATISPASQVLRESPLFLPPPTDRAFEAIFANGH